MRLNNLQLAVLLRLRDVGAMNAYRAGASLNTLNALSLKKVVKADRSRVGCHSTPRTSIYWEITDDGRRQVAHLDKDGLPLSNGTRGGAA